MVAIVDYGVGNLFSLSASLRHIGADCLVTRDEETLARCERIILPGVGAFGDAAAKLCECGLFEPLRALAAAGKPLLGICLGMQLLFEKGYEFGEHDGLGLIPGGVFDMRPDMPDARKIPQIGWNALHLVQPDDPLVQHIAEGDFVYFVHSFYAKGCEESLVAVADYGVTVPALVRRENVCGAQFHPEKSGSVGLAILRAFVEGGVGA